MHVKLDLVVGVARGAQTVCVTVDQVALIVVLGGVGSVRRALPVNVANDHVALIEFYTNKSVARVSNIEPAHLIVCYTN